MIWRAIVLLGQSCWPFKLVFSFIWRCESAAAAVFQMTVKAKGAEARDWISGEVQKRMVQLEARST